MKILCAALLTLAFAGAASADETFTATAEAKNAAGAVRTAPITITYSALSSAAQRDALFAALKTGGHTAVRTLLMGMKDIGFIEAGKKKVPVKYASPAPWDRAGW